MKYILDFDRTVFDTDALYKRLDEQKRSTEAGTLASLESLGDISDLVFSDAMIFFTAHNKTDLCIVSSCKGKSGNWERTYQEKKIEHSGISKFVDQVLVVESGKVAVISELVKKFSEDTVFVDDMLEHLETLNSVDKNLKLVQIKRNPLASTGNFPVISQLSELDAIIREL